MPTPFKPSKLALSRETVATLQVRTTLRTGQPLPTNGIQCATNICSDPCRTADSCPTWTPSCGGGCTIDSHAACGGGGGNRAY